MSDDVDGGTDADEIHALDDTTVERIAAGEVVERPASVVKELVENAIDADASRIGVEVSGDGTERLRITDDGVGMSEEAVQMAVRQHTTSKIRDADDLDAGVTTLGFRGEALHTIGAVSRMTITTKPRGTDGAGVKLSYEGGELVGVEPAGCPEGTSVEIRELFYNTPARRKFLGTESTEFAHVNRVVTQYALANPDVAVSLDHDGREVFSTTGQGDLRGTILSVYGREVASAMRPVEESLPDGPLAAVSGFVSDPETTRSDREYVSTYVNGRYVTDSTLRSAIVDAYGEQLAPDRYPFAVLFLDVPAGAVDVNVHPRKMEVRFDEPDAVHGQLKDVIRETLLSDGLIRTGAPRGRSAPDETDVRPERSGDGAESEAGDEVNETDKMDETRETGETTTGRSSEPTESDRLASDSGRSSSDRRTGERAAGTRSSASRERSDTAGSESSGSAARLPGFDANDESASESSGGTEESGRSERAEPIDRSSNERRFRSSGEQRTLDGESVTRTGEFETLPSLRVLGQLAETYVVAEMADGLVLIDQHAADERIHYERLQSAFAGETTAQSLAEPVELELTAKERSLFEEHDEALARLGFRAVPIDERRIAVRTVPTVFEKTLDPDLLRELLSSFVGSTREAATVEAAADELLADMACYPALTGNTSLTEGSVVSLLESLDDCENPYACPHGRPVLVEIDGDEIAERFERDYPGHGGRRDR